MDGRRLGATKGEITPNGLGAMQFADVGGDGRQSGFDQDTVR